jgi:hypothetical protein
VSWESLGSLLGVSWESLGSLLGVSWESLEEYLGSLLGVSYEGLGSLLEVYWESPGSLLGDKKVAIHKMVCDLRHQRNYLVQSVVSGTFFKTLKSKGTSRGLPGDFLGTPWGLPGDS